MAMNKIALAAPLLIEAVLLIATGAVVALALAGIV